MIRDMQIADLPGVRACAERLHEQSVYADVPGDLLTFSRTMGECVNSAFGFAMVSMSKGHVRGFMLGFALPLWFSKKRSATDIVTYCEHPGDGYRMIKTFINWAWSIPLVVEVTMAQSSGLEADRVGIIYERVGLQRVGNLYTAVRPAEEAEEAA